MAEDDQETEDEAQALERLLEEEAEKGDDESKPEEGEGGKKKKMIIALAAGGVLLIGGVLAFFLMGSQEEEAGGPESVEEAPVPTETKEEIAAREAAIRRAEAPKFYNLEPFFLPLVENKKETGQFVHVRVHLQMSNKKLDKEIEKVLPLIRQTIYEILERKRPKDYINPKKPIKERLKSEIVTSSNTLLVTGTGKIDDVFFSEFIIR